MLHWYLYLKNLLASEEGQDLIEYALIIVVIVIAAAVGMATIGDQIAAIYTAILAWLTPQVPAP